MTTFPTIAEVGYINPIKEQLGFKTLITQFDDMGVEQRKNKRLFPRRQISLGYRYITKAEAQTLFQFYIDRKGAYGVFKFFYENKQNDPWSYVKEYVGSGDGSTTIYNLPSKSGANYIVYLDNATVDEGSDYAFQAATGPDGEDKIIFVSAPSNGAIITYSFTGYLKIVCRFKEDRMDFETFYDRLVSGNLVLQGLLNDEA